MELNLAIAIALAALVAGITLEWLAGILRMRGYSKVRADVVAIANLLHGKVKRTNGDLLIRGRKGALPVTVTLSNSQSRPAVHIQVPAPGNLSLFCLPKGSQSGVPALEVADPYLAERFSLSSNNPQLARIIFLTPGVVAQLRILCRGSGTLLSLKEGQLEFSDLFIAEQNVAERVQNSLDAMLKMTAAAAQVPGAQPLTARPARSWNWFRAAYVTAPVLLVGIALGINNRQSHADAAPGSSAPPGIAEDDAGKIPDLRLWHLVQPGDFDPEASAWLRAKQYEPTGAIHGSFAASSPHDTAYLLSGLPNSGAQGSRLVVLINGKVRYDLTLPELALAARIPKENISSIEWSGRPPLAKPDGDGILVVRRYQDPSTAVVLYASGVQMVTGRPKYFQSIELR